MFTLLCNIRVKYIHKTVRKWHGYTISVVLGERILLSYGAISCLETKAYCTITENLNNQICLYREVVMPLHDACMDYP